MIHVFQLGFLTFALADRNFGAVSQDKVFRVYKFDEIHVQNYAMITFDETRIIFQNFEDKIFADSQKNYRNASVLVANDFSDLNPVERLHKNIKNQQVEGFGGKVA